MLLAVVLATGTAGAAFEVKDSGWEGASELLDIARERVGRRRVRPIAIIDWSILKPEDALLILHPERELDYREVAAFLSEGGRLAVLDDYGRADTLLKKFRILRVQPPLKPTEALRQNASLPIAFPSVDMVAGVEQVRHPVVAGVERVVTNHPTGLKTEPGVRLTPVLNMPGDDDGDTLLAVIGVIGNAKLCGLVDDAANQPVSAVTSKERCGRLFAMGDPSALINLMLRYRGNRAFANGLIDYLVADDAWGPRGGTLYLAANDIGQRGVYGGGTGLRRSLNDRFRQLRELIADARENGLPDPIAIALGAVAALGAALFMARAATRVYRRPVPRYARPTPLVAQGGVAGRAALLAAPTTHRALAVLEMKAALEEELRARLSLPKDASTSRILSEAAAQRVLPAPILANLEKLFREMAKAEMAVATSERIRLGADKIDDMRKTIAGIVRELDQQKERAT